jgi:AIPR protein
VSVIHVGHIKSAILTRFGNQVDLTDVVAAQEDQREKVRLSRSLAAFCIAELADLDDLTASQCVTDGSGDNGIDAIYYDTSEKCCFVVQSKWISNGNGSVEVGDIHKFIQGFRDILDANFDRFNAKMQKHKENIFAALSDASAKFTLVLAYTGEHDLSEDGQRPIDDLLAEMNSPTEVVNLRTLNQGKLHALVAGGVIGDSVDIEVMLRQWGIVETPFLAYYGQVAVSDVATWGKLGASLTSKNLRQFRGSTEVNEGIGKTLISTPEKFWYFNNGLTIICESLKKKLLGGNNNDIGTFECTGASVVNGAQTVGSIVETAKGDPDSLGDARVLVRLISLEHCPQSFGEELTRAANTQNRIEKRDFAALDPNQKRLRTELLLENQKEYSYQASDKAPQGDEGCTLDEAAISLACQLPDVAFAVQAKRELGVFYDDLTKPPYTLIFNAKTNAGLLWQAVTVMRKVESELKIQQSIRSGKDQLIAIHGNRFVLHVVFQQLKAENKAPSAESEISTLTKESLDAVVNLISQNFQSAYPANLFKNASKCRELAVMVLGQTTVITIKN